MGTDWLKKATAAAQSLDTGEVEVLPDFKERFPALTQFMASTVDADGRPRELCKLTVYVDNGAWKATLSDPNTECSLYRACGSPEGAFLAMEDALTSDRPDWRRWNSKGGNGRRRGS